VLRDTFVVILPASGRSTSFWKIFRQGTYHIMFVSGARHSPHIQGHTTGFMFLGFLLLRVTG